MLTVDRVATIVSTPAKVAIARSTAENHAALRVLPLASITEATVNPSGSLCRKMATKISHPSHSEMMNQDAIAIPSKNVCVINPMSTE